MKVKDIILSAATRLGISDGVSAYYENGDGTCEREAELLLSCYNSVEAELALDYLPLHAEEVLRTTTGALQFSVFSHSPVRILSIKNEKGENVEYSIYPKYVKTGAGTYTITYTYTPEKKTIDEEGEFGISMPEQLLLYGVLAEYCMAEGMFEDASAWDKKYKDAIETVYKIGTCTRLQSRRWI